VIPWQYTDLLKHITDESPTPTLTGEDIYLKEGFANLCRNHAVSKIHPDISTSEASWRHIKLVKWPWNMGFPWRCTMRDFRLARSRAFIAPQLQRISSPVRIIRWMFLSGSSLEYGAAQRNRKDGLRGPSSLLFCRELCSYE
jgi:hypothetical protein